MKSPPSSDEIANNGGKLANGFSLLSKRFHHSVLMSIWFAVRSCWSGVTAIEAVSEEIRILVWRLIGIRMGQQDWYYGTFHGYPVFFVTVDQHGGCSKRNFHAVENRFLQPVERGEPHSESASLRFHAEIASAHWLFSLKGKERPNLEDVRSTICRTKFLISCVTAPTGIAGLKGQMKRKLNFP